MSHSRKIAVIGLGYVGLPVAVAFARTGVPVIGFDIDPNRVEELRSGHDRTLEVAPADLKQATLRFENEPSSLDRRRFLYRDGADSDRRRPPAGSRRDPFGLRHGWQSSSSAATLSCTSRPFTPARSKKSACRSSKKNQVSPAEGTSPSAILRSGSIRATRNTVSKRLSKWFRRRTANP